MADIRKKLKMALVSGAAHALKYKRENPHVDDDELIQMVTRESNAIVSKLDSED